MGVVVIPFHTFWRCSIVKNTETIYLLLIAQRLRSLREAQKKLEVDLFILYWHWSFSESLWNFPSNPTIRLWSGTSTSIIMMDLDSVDLECTVKEFKSSIANFVSDWIKTSMKLTAFRRSRSTTLIILTIGWKNTPVVSKPENRA